MKRLRHLGFFKFKPEIMPDEIAAVWRTMENFQREIPGILEFTWGPDASTEGLADGFTHCRCMTFESVAARDAYLPHPVHQAAVQFVVPKLERFIVMDHEFRVADAP